MVYYIYLNMLELHFFIFFIQQIFIDTIQVIVILFKYYLELITE